MSSVYLGITQFQDADFNNFSYTTGIPNSLLAAYNIVNEGYSAALTGFATLPISPDTEFTAVVRQDNLTVSGGGYLGLDEAYRSGVIRKTATLTTNFSFVKYIATTNGTEISGDVLKGATLTGVQSGGMALYEHPSNLEVLDMIPAKYGSVNGIAETIGSALTDSPSNCYLAFQDFLNPVSEGVNADGSSMLSGTYYIGKWVYVKARAMPLPIFQDVYPLNTAQVFSSFGYESDVSNPGSSSDNRYGCIRIVTNRQSSFFASYGTEGFISATSGGRVTFTARFKGEAAVTVGYFATGLRSSSSPMGPRFLAGNAFGFEVDGSKSSTTLYCVYCANGQTVRGSSSIVWTNDNVVELVIDPAFSIAKWFLNSVQIFEANLDNYPEVKEALLTKAYSLSSLSTSSLNNSVSLDFTRLHKIVSR